VFFFEKKNQKTFACSLAEAARHATKKLGGANSSAAQGAKGRKHRKGEG